MWLGHERPIDRRKPLAHCPRCTSRLIYAVDAVGFGSEVILDRRCPECEYRGCATASAAAAAIWYRRDTRILGGLLALADALAGESAVEIVESGDRPAR
jgi:hypothetical protein